ncbi:Natural killer cells antigen CD94, partial [Galemys pyrenaicus]
TECCPCQDMWIGYRCNCYYISSVSDTWEESRNFCAFQNSTLLQMHNRDELASVYEIQQKLFLLDRSHLQQRIWSLGVVERLCCLSGSVSVYSPELPSAKNANQMNCISYNPERGVRSFHDLTGSSGTRAGAFPIQTGASSSWQLLSFLEVSTLLIFPYKSLHPSMEVDFCDLRSNVPFVDGYLGSCVGIFIILLWLLFLPRKVDRQFMRFSKEYYWIGATYNADRHAWEWLNGSAVPQDL